ncbi:MAG: GNAT family N-acetyltransferase [Blastocatellia bacterium]
MMVMETDRLILRRMTSEDAGFILELLNDADFLRNIGDRGVRSLEDARGYILNGPVESYNRFGFGLYLVERKDPPASIGICGLIKRDALEDVDIGFAFLPRFRSRGYAVEAASAVKTHARERIGLSRLAAITNPENHASIRVLEKLGLRFERMIRLSGEEAEIKLFTIVL